MDVSGDPLLVVTTGVVSLAFLALVGFVVWQLSKSAPSATARILVAVGGVLAELAVVILAFAQLRG